MVKQSIITRLGALERRMGISKEPLPTVFVHVTDASVPDPDGTALAVDYSDQAIIGAHFSHGGKEVIERNPGEKIEAFKKRLSKTLPDQRLFFMCYGQE